MPVSTVQDAFIEFERNAARVPAWQNDRAKEVHPKVRAAIERALGDLFDRAFLAGSYARKVQTVRLKDVDIIVVLKDPDGAFAQSADAALERLREAARTCALVLGTRRGVRAVKLTIDGEEFTVDLVAALPDPLEELRLARFLPAEGYDDWTPARPKGQLDAHWKKNADTNGVFLLAVRIVKYWNQRAKHKDKNALTSYLAESILFHSMTGEVEYAHAVLGFFRAAERHLSTATPTVPCPGDPGNHVDELFDHERRDAALTKVTEALRRAEAAVSEPDPATAMNHWERIFGPAFPAPNGDTNAVAEALRTGSAVATGTRISTTPGAGRQIIPARPWRTR